MHNCEVISILDDLIETCRRGQEASRNAAESLQTCEFRRLFNIISQQRAQFVTELLAEVHRLGGGAGKTASLAFSNNSTVRPLRRRSTTVKSAGMRDEASIIVEWQREEEAAVHNYQEALKADLPLDVQYVVQRQYMDVKDANDRIRVLRRAA